MDQLRQWREIEVELGKVAKILKCGILDVANVVEKKLKRIKALEKDVKRLNLFNARRI